jgi:ABC-type glycerol-3-phosphate transport system substrate-binding protein
MFKNKFGRVGIPVLVLGLVSLGVAPLAGASGTAPITLSFWTTVNVAAQQQVVESQANACASKLGNVTIDYTPVTSANEFTKLLTAFQSNNPPDIMNTDDTAVSFAQAAGHLIPATDVIKKLGESDFVTSALKEVSKNSQIWAVPDWLLHQEVWYRTDLFAAHGLKIPTTWAQLLADANTLDQGPNGIRGMAMPLNANQVAAQMFYSFFYADGGRTFNPKSGKYEFAADKAKAISAIETMAAIYKQVSPPASLSWSWDDFRTAFAKGQVAMTLDFGAVVSQVQKLNPSLLSKIAAFPLPGQNGPSQGTLGSGYYYMLGKTSPTRQAAAEKVLECMYQTPAKVAARANSRPVFALPATHSAATSPEFLSNPLVKQFKSTINVIEKQELPNEYAYGMEAGLSPLSAEIASSTFFGDDIQAVALGQMSAAAAFADINSNLRKDIAAS